MHDQGVVEELPERVAALGDAQGVVEHVPEMMVQFDVDAVLVEAALECLEHADQRLGGPLELDHLAGERVDAPGDLLVPVEELVLDLVDVVFEARDDGTVLVDDLVEDGVEHRLRAERQQFGGRLHPFAHPGQVRGFGVTDRDDEVRSDEHVQFAEFDPFLVVDVAGRAQHHEQDVVEALELGALVPLEGVFDGQVVQAELCGDGAYFPLRGPVHADPGEAVVRLHDLVGLVQRLRGRGPAAVHVDRVVDQCHRFSSCAGSSVAPGRTGKCRTRPVRALAWGRD